MRGLVKSDQLLQKFFQIIYRNHVRAVGQGLLGVFVRLKKDAVAPCSDRGPRQNRNHGRVTARGVAYVNLSSEATHLPGGSRSELFSVYSVVNSLVVNFPAVRRVQVLVEDRTVPSLAGHVDLSRPLPADMTLVALSGPPVAERGGPGAIDDPAATAETVP